MFGELTESIQADMVAKIFRVQVQREEPPPTQPVRRPVLKGPGMDGNGNGSGARVPAGVGSQSAAKVGRNDPCPCGSGRKYKRCHGR
jgi:preprotein translocase subunit SecA